MRPSCLDCARKHLAQALILIHETEMGYPIHKWIAIGHLAEASDELLYDYPQMAHIIRAERLNYMENSNYKINILDLISQITSLEDLENSTSSL